MGDLIVNCFVWLYKDKIIFEIANYQNKIERDSDQLLNFKLFLRRGTKHTQHHGGTTAPPHDKIKHLEITIRLLNIYKRLSMIISSQTDFFLFLNYVTNLYYSITYRSNVDYRIF